MPGALSPEKDLELAKFYLESAKDQALRNGIATAYSEHGKQLDILGNTELAQVSHKKAKQLRYVRPTKVPSLADSSATGSAGRDVARVAEDIFPDDMRQPADKCSKLPDVDQRLEDSSQLAYCLGLLQAELLSGEEFEPMAGEWVTITKNNPDEKERLKKMGIDLIRAFSRDELRDAKAIAEVVRLAPVLEKEYFRSLLYLFLDGIDRSGLLDVQSLEGLAQLVHSAPKGYLNSDDLARILRYLNTCLQDTHTESSDHICHLTLVVSNVLDVMVDADVSQLWRVELHEPLSAYMHGLRGSSDPYMVYQAAYAYQALQCVPNDESQWQATMRRAGIVVKTASKLVSAVKGLDVYNFIKTLGDIQETAGEVIEVLKFGFEGASALIEGSDGLLDSLKAGFNFTRKRAWYTALRGADTLLRDGQLAKFKTLVCEAPCRREVAFQLGICQRLGNLAANTSFDAESRRGAVAFLAEIYRNDTMWGDQDLVKQWIISSLTQLESTFGSDMPGGKSLLQELESDGDQMKTKDQSLYPLKVPSPPPSSPSLLDHVQNKADVESALRRLKNLRLKERENAVYISPMAKASLQAPDDELFPLMDKVKDFLSSNQKVMLLLGDSGAGKSTFNRALECDLWDAYEKTEGRIPLFISLPTIDKPEQGLIAKYLHKMDFRESQIRELKHRNFILICDGYDESQQTHNLYMSNQLNEPGEWIAQMIISCRSEYLGLDHQDQFQPAVDRNHQAKLGLFQEAVIAPFSEEQVQGYIKKYVSVEAPPWNAADYSETLSRIPGLQDLVKNPFMLTLALKVLPRMVDQGQNLLATQITRVALYGHFVEQWLERGKKRISETKLSGAKERAFEVLVKEGFKENGIAFLKDLAAAIYERQSGNPVVEYRRFVDEGTWKDAFFGRDCEKQLLLEASPFIINGNQYRFIHKSILEYCVARAVFEPRENGLGAGSASALNFQRDTSPLSSLENQSAYMERFSDTAHAALESALMRINFAGKSSILQFLEERVLQDPDFKKQLFAVIERSKSDKKLRLAGANAITILNVAHPIIIKYELPEPDQRIISTPQLAYCLSLLPSPTFSVEGLDETERAWSQAKVNDPDEQQRLRMLAKDLVAAFIDEEFMQGTIIAEVVCMAPVLDREQFRILLMKFIDGIHQSTLLAIHPLEGLAQLMQGATQGHLDANDLIKILDVLSTRLKDTHQQSKQYVHRLTLAVSRVLDVMADCHVENFSRIQLHEPLSDYLSGLKSSSDPYLVYQAAYAFQALQYVPDVESPLQVTLRRSQTVEHDILGDESAAKDLDLESFIDGLMHIQEGLSTSHVVQSSTPYQGVTSLMDNGKLLLDSIKECFKYRNQWYPALRGIDTLLQVGQLAKSKKLVYSLPCRRDPAFQWGVCQRLGELAGNPRRDEFMRQHAIAFLGELYEDDEQWGQHATVKQWILKIIIYLETSTESPVKDSAGRLLQELEKNGDVTKRALFEACLKEGPVSYPLTAALPQLTSSLLLNRVQNKPDVETDLRRLRNQRLKETVDAVYISPLAKASLQAPDDELFPLMDKVSEFLSSNQKVMLILGDSGAGKSTFNRALECELWRAYDKKKGQIPLFISLPVIDKPEQGLIVKHLHKMGFRGSQIRELKERRKFILICDGYDESKQTHNLYTSNRLNLPGEWCAQMIISCRSEYLGLDYQSLFQPPTNQNYGYSERLFQEAVIVPFSKSRVEDYVEQYVSINKSFWRTKDYLQALDQTPRLLDLVTNPFLLTLALEVLPHLMDPGQSLSDTQVTRVALYDQFVEQWLDRGEKRLAEKDLTHQEQKVFQRLSDEGFVQNGIDFLKKLAAAIYKEQAGYPVVEYSHFKDEGTWKEAFFCQNDAKDLLREACPLTHSGNQYRFIHRSLLEYGLARAVFEPQEGKISGQILPRGARRGSVSSMFSFEDQIVSDESFDIQRLLVDHPLARRNFVGEPSILQFLAERLQQEPLFKTQLLAMIEHSKVDKEARKAAANAITILIRAGILFNGADLKGIRIPGADLSGGQFDSAQLQGADLRKVNLRNVWLRQADLESAQMAGVQFGEWPYLKEDQAVASCAYSPDQKTYAVGVCDGTISLYDSSTSLKIYMLHGHTGSVTSVMYSPTGHQIASCGDDNTVRLWDAQTGSPGLTLTGHTDSVMSVMYSPSGHQIASGSCDKTVRLWDAQTGSLGLILTGHTDSVMSVVYSPSGHQIASGSYDKTVRLWDAQTGSLGLILTGHTDSVMSVVYSPSGHQIASGSYDKTVRLWDVQTGAIGIILSGHSNHITSVVYSPSGHQIASGSYDKTVRLWDAQTGASGPVFSGHTNAITSVVYSPSGHQIASGSHDKTVRLWDAQISTLGPISSGHTDSVMGVVYSPSGRQIASGSYDKTVRLWDAQTGASGPILSGHINAITSVMYSPSGYQIASGSRDRTVRLWDAQTGASGPILRGHTNAITSVMYSPSGHQIASCSDDNMVRLWNAQTGAPGPILSGHTDSVMSVVYSPSGHQVASGSYDMTVRLWDAQTGASGPILSGHTNAITSVMYSPSGHQIASCSDDNMVRLWNAQTGAPGPILIGHTDSVMSVVYSPSGQQIASCSYDTTVRLWDANVGQCLAVVEGFDGIITSICWNATPHGTYFAAGSSDKSVGVWKVIEEEDHCQVRLQWTSMHAIFDVSKTSIQNAQGLTRVNMELLQQRGAVGEMILPLRLR
ncbi:hypothetical protein BGZ98_008181 [Dissophora globulifera]|nr:hypothetical protein BGZ98_008181 [Dissophora globulifera]